MRVSEMQKEAVPGAVRFGEFELDPDAGELRKNGHRLKIQPQPFKLLVQLTRRAGSVVTREEIRRELWADGTFVDYDQAMNFAVKQVRDALSDSAEQPLFIETVPRRGYRFIAPLESVHPERKQHAPEASTTTVRLQKALWTNIAELRVSEARRRRQLLVTIAVLSVAVVALVTYLLLTP